MRKILLILIATILIASCKGGKDDVKVMDIAAPPPKAEPMIAEKMINSEVEATGSTTANDKNTTETTYTKKIIKEGEIRFETGNLQTTRKILTDTLTKLGGYVDEEGEKNNYGSDRKDYTLNIRIPAQNFEKFLSAVSSSADRIESKSIRIKDVTTEYIDISTRLTNKKLLEERYKALLQKAGKMADILEVENKLTEIRTDIETTQGQLNYLNKQIAYSSFNITFFTQSTVKNDGNGFNYKLKTAFGDSLSLLQNMFFGFIAFLPVIILLFIGYLLLKAWRKRRANKTIL